MKSANKEITYWMIWKGPLMSGVNTYKVAIVKFDDILYNISFIIFYFFSSSGKQKYLHTVVTMSLAFGGPAQPSPTRPRAHTLKRTRRRLDLRDRQPTTKPPLPKTLKANQLNTSLNMNLLHNTVRSSSTYLMRNVYPHHGLRSLLSSSASLRRFSTESAPPTNQSSSTKPLFQTPSSGLVYGKLVGITKNTLKSDVLSLFEECKLSSDDLKVDYNPSYSPTGMIVQFSSRSAYDAALRAVAKKGRLLIVQNWDYIQPYDGKYVLLQGIPPNANFEDIERFLAGCEYDASSIRLFFRQGASGPTRMALVRCLSPIAAMSAMMITNRGFCFNNQILVNVLQ
ncbi:unnamed protein product [Lactuca virosa]|uniref:RRM domain-containing protein n=1 Tax=Lactuca virosa TaxID=75947 RepID=A0AAU9PP77_9ASTR|nr:unnamed protein product [Lactuca virosa]